MKDHRRDLPPSIPWLRDALADLTDPYPSYRGMCYDIETKRPDAEERLGKLGPEAIPAVIQALSDSSAKVRRGALEMLAKFRQVEPLVQTLDDPDPDVRLAAVQALQARNHEAVRNGGLEVARGLAARLIDTDAHVAIHAAAALSTSPVLSQALLEAHRAALEARRTDPDDALRRAAGVALLLWPDPPAPNEWYGMQGPAGFKDLVLSGLARTRDKLDDRTLAALVGELIDRTATSGHPTALRLLRDHADRLAGHVPDLLGALNDDLDLPRRQIVVEILRRHPEAVQDHVRKLMSNCLPGLPGFAISGGGVRNVEPIVAKAVQHLGRYLPSLRDEVWRRWPHLAPPKRAASRKKGRRGR